MSTTCFICSLDRDAFQSRARGIFSFTNLTKIDFQHHVEKEHNRLHYFYFFAWLRDLEVEMSQNVINEEGVLSKLEEQLKEKVQGNCSF